MKKIISSLIIVLINLCAYAQKDVTQFLGIPVDGSKSEMIRKLKAKGFSTNYHEKDVLQGEFNGKNVNVHVVTNNNKVYRIMVCDADNVDERSIQIRFNNLCQQFENNSKYIPYSYDLIPDDENISYEINVKNKRYEAVFIQKPLDSTINSLIKEAANEYTAEELENPTDNLYYNKYVDLSLKKIVWFMISEHYGKYYIVMFYDNEYNKANGEDL